MKVKLKNIIIIGIIIAFNSLKVMSYTSIIEDQTILVIGSYSFQNEWEKSILDGFETILGNKNTIKVEYLDSYSKNTLEYHESFLNYLDAKYENQEIDYIFVMDDESLEIIYKKPVFFVGVNSMINLTDEEKKYLSGVINVETCLDCISLIQKINKNIKTVYLFCDNSIYSKSIISNVSSVYPEEHDGLAVKIFNSNNINYMQDVLKTHDFSDSVILLCGTYINESTKSIVASSDVIDLIKSITKVPIYSTLYNYVEGGAVGGVVNDGGKLGKIGAMLLNSVANQDSVSQAYILTPSYNSINTALFNFRAIREYHINPLNLPEDSSFINKKSYNILLPESMIYAIWIGAGMTIVLVVYLGCISFYRKKKLKEANYEAMAAIERENIKTDCIIIMSHEFRTPINVIMNSAKLLLMKCAEDDLDKEYFKTRLNYIIKNSNRLNKAVNNSIDVAKLESGIMSTTFKMHNIIKVVEDITDTIIDFAAASNIEIIFDTEEEEVYTAIDKRSIERIMLNLLSNAIKSIRNGGTIFVNCRNDSENIYIYVKDTGIGMSEEIKRHIFEKFFQASDYALNRRHEGNGLGLFIVNGLVKLHNGFINVESKEGEGTTFEVVLPINVVDDEGEDNSSNDDLNCMAKIELSDID